MNTASNTFTIYSTQTTQQFTWRRLDSAPLIQRVFFSLESSVQSAAVRRLGRNCDRVVLDGRKSPNLSKETVTLHISLCMRFSCLAQDMLDLAGTAKCLAQKMSEPRQFDLIPLQRVTRYLVGKPRAAINSTPKARTHQAPHGLCGQRFRRRPSLSKEHARSRGTGGRPPGENRFNNCEA